MGYATAAWLSFGGALAAVAGALTGLLFVALPVKGDALAASRSLRSRAAQTLVLFMISVLIAVLLVAPQPPGALGCGSAGRGRGRAGRSAVHPGPARRS